jgi:2-keto-3-deoxy-L-rhamnonate aldolase RhmA
MQLHMRLHECMEQGRAAYGAISSLNSPLAVELTAHSCDLDFMIVDMQHSATTVADSVHLARAIQAADADVAPVARIPTQDKYWVEQSLDAGYVGLIVPLSESGKQAEAMVRAAYYPPKGARSLCGTIRASLYENYVGAINERLVLLPQIESAAGLEHCEEIAAVEGVTGLLFGPTDLSLSCGWSGMDRWDHPPFLEALERVVAACRNENKLAAVMIARADAARARDIGFRMIGCVSAGGSIRSVFSESANEDLRALRDGDPGC